MIFAVILLAICVFALVNNDSRGNEKAESTSSPNTNRDDERTIQNKQGISVDLKDLDLAKYELNNLGISYTQEGDSLIIDSDRVADAVNAIENANADVRW